jgi:hypothetical protein
MELSEGSAGVAKGDPIISGLWKIHHDPVPIPAMRAVRNHIWDKVACGLIHVVAAASLYAVKLML